MQKHTSAACHALYAHQNVRHTLIAHHTGANGSFSFNRNMDSHHCCHKGCSIMSVCSTIASLNAWNIEIHGISTHVPETQYSHRYAGRLRKPHLVLADRLLCLAPSASPLNELMECTLCVSTSLKATAALAHSPSPVHQPQHQSHD